MRLPEKIALDIHKEIKKKELASLPSHRLLAQHYGVAPETIRNAIHILKCKGIVQILHGKKTTVAGAVNDATRGANTAAGSFARIIRDKIENGVYRSGQVLPKFFQFTTTHHISVNTVRGGLELLRQEGLIHKQGKKWMVGPPEQNTTGTPQVLRRQDCPTVLILMKNFEHWQQNIRSNDFILSFLQEFLNEIKRYDIQFKLVFHENKEHMPDGFSTGKSGILHQIKSAAENYVGTVLIGATNIFPDIADYALWLTQFAKPVVWFNYVSFAGSGKPSPKKSGYYYFTPDHGKLVDLAVTSLHEQGHKRILFPVPRGIMQRQWVAERRKYIDLAVRNQENKPIIKNFVLREKIWDTPKDIAISMTSALSRIQKSSRRHTTEQTTIENRKKMYFLSPSLADAISHNAATAILAPNQECAVAMYHYLKNIGCAIPADLSIVTFDNRLIYSCYPISTVDWAFDDAGYWAAHIFAGVLPVKTGKNRTVHQHPVFVDRGSTSMPRKHTLTFSHLRD